MKKILLLALSLLIYCMSFGQSYYFTFYLQDVDGTSIIVEPTDITWSFINVTKSCTLTESTSEPGSGTNAGFGVLMIEAEEWSATMGCAPWGAGDDVTLSIKVTNPAHPYFGYSASWTGKMLPAASSDDIILTLKGVEPTLNVSNATLCIGETGKTVTATITDPPTGFTIDWGDANITSDATDVKIGKIGTGLAAGTHNLTASLKKADGTVVKTAAYKVTVNPKPVIAITGGTEACDGTKITLTASGGTTYKWTGGPNTALYEPVVTANATYTVEVTTAAGCKDTKDHAVTKLNNPTVTVGAIQDKCKGGTVDLTANGSGGTGTLSYSWSNGGGNTQNPTNVAVPAAGNNDYTVTVTDVKGCKVTATQKVTGHEVTVTISGTTSINNGQTTTLTANPTYTPAGGAASPENYLWTGNINGSTTTKAVISNALSVNETFTVKVTDRYGCEGTKSQQVTVTTLEPTLSVSNQTLCVGETGKTVTATVGNPPTGFTIDWGDANITSDATDPKIGKIGIGLAAGTHNLTASLKKADGTVVKTAGYKVTVNALPTIAITGGVEACDGTKISLTASGGTTYKWTGGPNTALYEPVVTANATYTVEVTTAAGCKDTKDHAVTKLNNPTVTVGAIQDACKGGTVNLTANGAGGNGTLLYAWSNGGGNVQNPTGVTVPVAGNNDYTVTVTDAKNCKVTAIQKVTGHEVTVTIAGPATVANGGTVSLTATPVYNPLGGAASPENYLWTGNINGATNTNTITSNVLSSASNFDVKVTDKYGCEGTKTHAVNVTGAALAGVPTDADGCQGSVITLNSNATGGSGDYSTTTWAPSAGLQLSATTGATVQVKNTTPAGNYTVSVVIKDGVTTLPAQTVNVTVKALPTLANISPSVTINAGASATISVDPTPGDAVCTWTPGPLVGKTHTVSPTVTTTYSVTAEKNGCTSAPLTTTVTVRTGPGLALAGDNVNGCEGEAVPELSVTATGGAGGYVFTWGPVAGITFGTPVEIAGTSRVSIVNGNTLPAGTYTIPVSVRDGDGTVQNTTIQVVITRCTCTARLAMTVGAKPCGSLTATATLTLTATGGNTYSFVLKDPLNNTVLTAVDEVGPWTYTVAFGDRGTYRVENFKGKTATVPAGCDGVVNPANLDVQFWTPPTVSAGADMSICGNDQVTLRGTGTAGVTYTWDNGAVNNVPFTPVMGTVTTYTVTGTDGHGCSATDEVVVSVNPKPTVTASVNPTEICKGETVVLTPGGDADTYTWNNGGVSGIPVAPANTIRYTVTGTVTGTGCSDTASVLVKVNQAPEIISVTPANKIKRIAIGKDAVLSVEAIGENLSYQWWRQADGSDVWTELMNATTGYPQIMGVATPELSLKVVPQSWHNSKLKCIVTNACGSAEAEFSLSVSECFEITGDLVMGQGIMPDAIPGDAIDGWYCIGTRIALHAKIFQEEGYTIDNPHYKWFIDGEPAEKVIESDSSTLSWIPEFWEDDIVVKVCMYSDGACEEVCTKYIRLKARPFADAKVKILTSIDPERSFCPGEVIDFSVSTKGEGSAPEFHWYNDIFDMGIGRNKVLTMTEEDTWIKVEMRPSSEICIKDQFVADTIHLTVKKSVTPTLSLSNSINNDTVACRGDKVIFTAVYTNAGAKPLIKWQGDVWNLGTGPTAEVTLNDKDVWVKCELYPSHDVCYGKDTLVAIMPLRVLEDISVTITSDMADKNPGDEITFVSEVKNFIENMKYEWFVNRGLVEDDEEDYIGYNLRSGDIVYCAVSGNQICQTRVLSNEIEVKFGNVSRDTIVEIYKNERIKKLDLFKIGDEDKIFVIPNDGRPAFGIANITAKGSFNYTPAFDFSGNDMVRYLVRDKFDKDRVEEGYVYISVKENSRFFVPNIITPNGDGLNDTWILDFLSEYPNHTVTIYNDRGNPVFVAKNYQNDWDGSGQSNTGYISQFNLPNGIYTYVIDLGNKTQLKSWIEIRADFNRGKFR